MTTATVNDLATGAWTDRVGDTLEVVGPGINPCHTIMRRPGERRKFGMPTRWLSFMVPEPEPAVVVETVANTTPLPDCCPTCGRELEES